MLDREQSELGTGWGSYAVILLVSLLIAKFNGMSVHCYVVALFSALRTEFEVCCQNET